MRKMDIMINFDVFEGISDQYFVVKKSYKFFAKKSCQKPKGTPFAIGMKSNVTWKCYPLELAWNIMLPEWIL